MIDGAAFPLHIDNADQAQLGPPGRLSTPATDPTAGQPWYDRGYTVTDLFAPAEFAAFKDGITATLRDSLGHLGRDTTGFTLERYHHHVDDAAHAALVARTRDLFQRDLPFDIAALHARLGTALGMPLTDTLPGLPGKLHVIIRINRPGSGDFNPVHKDIYEAVDHLGIVPPLVNFWIPVAGVSPFSALPLAPGSHLIDESRILRTRAGSVVEGRHYRVNSVLDWDGSRALERVRISDGQALIFSSHLIHGLAVNAQPDTTRVAVEFRLGPLTGASYG
jgi:hypothetical protein